MGFMQALSNVLQGPQQQQQYADFVNRYHQGPPGEGYSDEEVAQRYKEVAPHLPPQDYQQAAQEAFERMSPQERDEFARYVQQRAQQRGMQFPPEPGRYSDPGELARTTTRVQQEQPDILGNLLGPGGALGGTFAKAALAGIAAMAASRVLGGRR